MTNNPRLGSLFDSAWNGINKKLALTMGLTLVYFIAQSVLSIIPFAGMIVGVLLSPGYLICLDHIRRDRDFSYQEFFWCFLDFQRIIHYSILTTIKALLVILGFIFLVLPGVYLSIALILAESVFVFRNQDGIHALKHAKKITEGRWWYLFKVLLVIMLFNLGGLVCLGIGLLITVPMSVIILLELLDNFDPQ